MTFVNKITLILAGSLIKNQNALYMSTSNQIEGFVSERAYSVTKQL